MNQTRERLPMIVRVTCVGDVREQVILQPCAPSWRQRCRHWFRHWFRQVCNWFRHRRHRVQLDLLVNGRVDWWR